MENEKSESMREDKSTQDGTKLTQSSSINIEPPKQSSAPSPSTRIESINVIKPPETTQAVNIKRGEKEEKPEFLKHSPKKPDKKEKSRFMGIVIILSLIISTCSIILLLFCVKNVAMPQFIQQAIDYLYKIAQNHL